jgi:hypothetical protein
MPYHEAVCDAYSDLYSNSSSILYRQKPLKMACTLRFQFIYYVFSQYYEIMKPGKPPLQYIPLLTHVGERINNLDYNLSTEKR